MSIPKFWSWYISLISFEIKLLSNHKLIKPGPAISNFSKIFIFWFSVSIFFKIYGLYFLAIFFDALLKNKSLKIAFLAVYAVVIQFFGYGLAFVKSTFLITFSNKKPEQIFPKLFFNWWQEGF